MSSQLSPASDESTINSFKKCVMQAYGTWLSTRNLPQNQISRIGRAYIPTIPRWISFAWASIPQSVIQTSFKKCFTTNVFDSSSETPVDHDNWEEESEETISDDFNSTNHPEVDDELSEGPTEVEE